MKTKNIPIILLCLVLTAPAFAAGTSFRERNESRQQRTERSSFGSGGLRGDGGPPTIPTDVDPPTDPSNPGDPIGNGIWLLTGLGLAYGAYLFGKKRKEALN